MLKIHTCLALLSLSFKGKTKNEADKNAKAKGIIIEYTSALPDTLLGLELPNLY